VKKEMRLQDSINIMRIERFGRVQAYKERLKNRKNKGDSLFMKAIAALKNQVGRIEAENELAEKAAMKDVATFNAETVRQQVEIGRLLGQIGMYNNYGVSKYQEWSVVSNIENALNEAATSALSSGQPFEPIISSVTDKGFDRTAWSSKIIATCNEDKSSGFDTMKEVALNNRIKALQDRFN
jgi:hypothetical protein